MYSKETYEEIKKRILSSITIDIDKREGSFINDMISPLSVELAKTYIELDNILKIAFIETAYDDYLDLKVNEFGVIRKPGEFAKGIVKITGKDDVVIPNGTKALTDDGLEFVLEGGTIKNGVALLPAAAIEVGKKYNVLANSINKLSIDLFGVDSITNEENFSNGIDRESDDELRNRFFNFIRKPKTSGNINNYEQWALEVDGVENVKVKPLWNGPGTVKVLISGKDNKPVSQEIINSCSNYIENLRPIGATVTVSTSTLFEVTISVDLDIESYTTLEKVKEILKIELNKYFLKCNDEIVFTKVGGIISAIDGVLDYRNLTINSVSSNVQIPNEQVVNLIGLVVS